MITIGVKVSGVVPLLMHKFSAAAEASLTGDVKKSVTKKDKPEEAAEEVAYRLEPQPGEKQGRLCVPGEHVYQSMVRAASSFQVKGQGKKTYKDAVAGNVLIEPEFIPLLDEHGKPVFKFEIDSRPVRIGKSRVMRHRPVFAKWSLEFTIQVLDDDSLPESVANAILVKAGETKGVADYRPRFGRFMVNKFEVTRRQADEVPAGVMASADSGEVDETSEVAQEIDEDGVGGD